MTDDDLHAALENSADRSVWDVAERCQHEGRARKETFLGVMDMAKQLLAIREAMREIDSHELASHAMFDDLRRLVGLEGDGLIHVGIDWSHKP